jgi:alginate O-acetyltransferase complex protein AlgJ
VKSAAAHTKEALFGDEKIPVALVGTSYSANPLWNFAGFLEEALQTDVINAAEEGQGPFETMKTYLASAAFRDNPPELVVWEIPERYLVVDAERKAP